MRYQSKKLILRAEDLLSALCQTLKEIDDRRIPLTDDCWIEELREDLSLWLDYYAEGNDELSNAHES